MPGLILASASPRRRTLLAEAGYRFEVCPAEVEESIPDYLTVSEAVLLNAKRKASWVSERHRESLVIGVDTLVSFEGRALGKPANLAEAKSMLARLSGQTHEVFSGVWLRIGRRRRQAGFVEASRVRFRKLTGSEIERYVKLIDPLDKAGGYAAQEDPMGIIAEIEGSRSNVIGLPMERLGEVIAAL